MTQHVLKMVPACSDWTALYLIFIVKTKLKSQFLASHSGTRFVVFCVVLGASLDYPGSSWKSSCSLRGDFWTIPGLSWVILAPFRPPPALFF